MTFPFQMCSAECRAFERYKTMKAINIYSLAIIKRLIITIKNI